MQAGGFATASTADDGVEPGVEAENGSFSSPSQATGIFHAQLTQEECRRLGGWTRAWGARDLSSTPTLHCTAIAIQQGQAQAFEGGGAHFHPGESGAWNPCSLEVMAVAAENFGEIRGLVTDACWKGVIEVLPLDSEQMPCLKHLLQGRGVQNA